MTTSKVTDIVKLNVGGTRMETLKSTLIQLPYFESKLTRWSNSQNSDELFVDYDPILFAHLLNKLRNPQHEFPSIHGIDAMCQYFGYTELGICNIINVIKEKNPSRDQHRYIVNTVANKLFRISVYQDKFSDIRAFHVSSTNNHFIFKIGKLGVSHFFEEVHPNILELRQIYLDKLQNHKMVMIDIYFSKEANKHLSAVYIKTQIDMATQSNTYITKSQD